MTRKSLLSFFKSHIMNKIIVLLLLSFSVVETFCQTIYTNDLNELVSIAEQKELSKLKFKRKIRKICTSTNLQIDSARVVYNYNSKDLQDMDTLVILTRYYSSGSTDPSYTECVLNGSAAPSVGFVMNWRCFDGPTVGEYTYSYDSDPLVTYLRLNDNGFKAFINTSESTKGKIKHTDRCPSTTLFTFIKQPDGGYVYNAYPGCECVVIDRFDDFSFELILWEVYNKRDIDDEAVKQIISKY